MGEDALPQNPHMNHSPHQHRFLPTTTIPQTTLAGTLPTLVVIRICETCDEIKVSMINLAELLRAPAPRLSQNPTQTGFENPGVP